METMTVVSGADLAKKKQEFVAGRFAEFDTFGRSDIEKWLKEQRNAESPHFGNSLSHCLHNHNTSDFGWEFYLWRMFNGGDYGVSVLPNCTHLEALQTYGALVAEGMQKHAENYPLLYKEKDLLSLFLGFANGRAYCLYNGFVFDFGGTLGVFTFTRKHGDCEGSINFSRGVWPMSWMESVLMNWSDCSDEASRIKARNFLCDCLERRIQLVERKDAEREFDMAVAVSVDGKKIIHADKVFLYTTRESGQTSGIEVYGYSPKDFAQQKLVREDLKRSAGLAKSAEPSNEEILEIIRANGNDVESFLYDRIVAGFESTRIFFFKVDTSHYSEIVLTMGT